MNSLNSLCLIGVRFPSRKIYKMENMGMIELRALTRERGLRGYSRLRNAELIAFLQENENHRQQRIPTTAEGPAPGVGSQAVLAPLLEVAPQQPQQPLTKRQCKHSHAKDAKLAKCFTNLSSEIDNLKSQLETIKDKILHTSKSTHSRFKGKKIRSMKREVDKITMQIAESEAHLDSMRVLSDLISGALIKQHPLSRSKRVEAKIAELTKKIGRAKNRRNKECLMAHRNVL